MTRIALVLLIIQKHLALNDFSFDLGMPENKDLDNGNKQFTLDSQIRNMP